MKNLKLPLLILSFFAATFSKAQSAHSTIRSFGIIYEDGNLNQVSSVLDSTVIIKYVIELKDTSSVKKIYARVSTANSTSGDVFSGSFFINPIVQTDASGKTIFLRDKNKVFITTANSTQLNDLNFEIATEDYNGQTTGFLNWKK